MSGGLIQRVAPPATAVALRPYQVDSLAGIRAAFAAGDRSTLVVQATGTGKTVVFAEAARLEVSVNGRALILVHRDELVRQARRKLEAIGISADVEKGKERAGSFARVVIASVQSLRGARLQRFAHDRFTLIIVDEAHHAVAPGYRAVLDYFATARVLGVTATPDRADGTALGEVFASVAYRYEMREAIRDAWLAPIVARRIVVEGVDLGAVKTRAGDLAQDQLAAVMETETAIRGVVVPLLDLARDRPTIVFGVDVAHATARAAALNAVRPDSAVAVSGATDDDVRERVLADFAAGRFQFLCNCALFTEGFDEPTIACVANVAPTKSRAVYVQRVGRGTRLSPETGKTDCLLLDFTGAAGKHRLIGPIDCLAGAGTEIPDDIRAEADRLFGTAQLELEQVLVAADAEAAKRRSELEIEAVVRYHAEHIDLFLGDELPTDRETFGSAAQRPSERQLAMLDDHGVELRKLPSHFSDADASRLIGRLLARRDLGLCSLKAARILSRCAKLDTRGLTHARAKELLAILGGRFDSPWLLRGQPEYDAAHPAAFAVDLRRTSGGFL